MNQNYMSLIDWAILVIPVVFVVSMGFYSRRYIRGVSDYLACGRVCGRYVLNMGDVATIRKSRFETKLVKLNNRSFYDVVNAKFQRKLG